MLVSNYEHIKKHAPKYVYCVVRSSSVANRFFSVCGTISKNGFQITKMSWNYVYNNYVQHAFSFSAIATTNAWLSGAQLNFLYRTTMHQCASSIILKSETFYKLKAVDLLHLWCPQYQLILWATIAEPYLIHFICTKSKGTFPFQLLD